VPATHEHASAAALIAVECAVIAISAALICASIRLERLQLRKGVLLATAAGGLFGTSDIAIKHLVHPALNHVMLLVNPWTLSALIAMVVAFYASARSLQLGPAIAVITFTSLTANIVALLGGILVFHHPVGQTPLQIAARLAAFGLVILGAALLPGRHRAGAPHPGRRPAPDPRAGDRDAPARRYLRRGRASKLRMSARASHPRTRARRAIGSSCTGRTAAALLGATFTRLGGSRGQMALDPAVGN